MDQLVQRLAVARAHVQGIFAEEPAVSTPVKFLVDTEWRSTGGINAAYAIRYKPRYSYSISAPRYHDSPTAAISAVHAVHHALCFALVNTEIAVDLPGGILGPIPIVVERKGFDHGLNLLAGFD